MLILFSVDTCWGVTGCLDEIAFEQAFMLSLNQHHLNIISFYREYGFWITRVCSLVQNFSGFFSLWGNTLFCCGRCHAAQAFLQDCSPSGQYRGFGADAAGWPQPSGSNGHLHSIAGRLFGGSFQLLSRLPARAAEGARLWHMLRNKKGWIFGSFKKLLMNPPTLKIAYFFLMGNYGQYLRFWDMSSLRLLPRSRTIDPSRGKVRLQPHQDA